MMTVPKTPASKSLVQVRNLSVDFGQGDDTVHAAKQFIELTTVGLFKPRIFGAMEEVPARSVIEKNVLSAIRVFLAAYGSR